MVRAIADGTKKARVLVQSIARIVGNRLGNGYVADLGFDATTMHLQEIAMVLAGAEQLLLKGEVFVDGGPLTVPNNNSGTFLARCAQFFRYLCALFRVAGPTEVDKDGNVVSWQFAWVDCEELAAALPSMRNDEPSPPSSRGRAAGVPGASARAAAMAAADAEAAAVMAPMQNGASSGGASGRRLSAAAAGCGSSQQQRRQPRR